MRVHDDGSIAGACVGSKGTERYDVRVRVSVAHDDAAHPPPQGASTFEGAWIEATCTCPATTKPPFVQYGAAAAGSSPRGSCRHSCALLLWRARTLSAPRDPTAAAAAAVDGDVDDAPAVDDTTATQPADPHPRPRPPPPPGAGRREAAPPARSLVQAAAAAGSAATDRATKTARKGAAKGTAGGEGGGEEAPAAGGPRRADASKGASTARVKREPGSVAGGGGAATAGAAGESESGANGSRQREDRSRRRTPAPTSSPRRAMTDEQLLAASRSATAAEKAAPDAAPTAPSADRPAAPAVPAAPAAPAAPRPPRRKDLLDDLFDFAPVPSPSSGTTREGSSVEPAPAPDPVPAATISTAAVMNGAVGGANGSRQREGSEPVSSGSGGAGGPRKISLAELLGEYGMG